MRATIEHTLIACGLLIAAAACGGKDKPAAPDAMAPDIDAALPATSIRGTASYTDVTPSASGLNYSATVNRPIRGARIQLLDDATSAVLAETTTAADGSFAFDNTGLDPVRVRVLAEITTPSIRVQDNTDGDAIYALDSGTLDPLDGDAVTLVADLGWGGDSYDDIRAAAPFAILDTAYASARLFSSARDVTFPPLRINWSPDNRPENGDKAMGQIQTSHWDGDQLWILGKQDIDTDEFDSHIVVHEWGHYFEASLSRSDSIGGDHAIGEIIDARVAFGEGFGNALSGWVLSDPNYIDTGGVGQSLVALSFDLEANLSDDNTPGWFSESSVQSILYDLVDTQAEAWDSVAIDIGVLYDVLTGHQKSTPGFTTIFSFIHGLKQAQPTLATEVDALLAHHNIQAIGDDFGNTETNDGGFPGMLPVYHELETDGTEKTVTLYGSFRHNQQPQSRYLGFEADGSTVTIAATSAQDVALTVVKAGETIAQVDELESGTETTTINTEPGAIYLINISGFHQAMESYECAVSVTAQ